MSRRGGELPFPCRLLIVDGFYDFTPVEETLLRALADRADRVICTLPLEESRPGLFAPCARTRERLRRVLEAQETALDSGGGRSPGVGALERGLFEQSSAEAPTEGVVLLEASSRRAEVELVAGEICHLVGEEGASYQDIAVLFRSPRLYADVISQVFNAYRIPFAFGEAVSLAATGMGRFLSALADFLAEAGDTDSPVPLAGSSYLPEQSEAELRERCGRLRQALEACATGEAAAGAIEEALREWGVLERVVPDRSDGHLLAASDLCALEAGLEAVAGVVDWLARSGRWSLQEVARCLPRALAAAHARQPNWRAPGVRVVSVHEARAHAFPVVFLCDLAHGSFPVVGAEDAFLDEQARRSLVGEGRRLPPARPSLEEERLLFYLAVTRAQRRLYLSRPYLDDQGRPMIPSPFWEEAKRCLAPSGEWRGPLRRRGLEHLVPRVEEVTSSAEARLALGATMGAAQPEPEGLGLLSAAPRIWLRRIAEARLSGGRVGEEHLRSAAAKSGLMPVGEAFSATLLERFAACPFQCFCERFLRLGAAEGAAATLGLFLHEALSRFFRASEWRGEQEGAEEARRQLLQTAADLVAQEGYFGEQNYECRYMRAHALDILSRFVDIEMSLGQEREGRACHFEVVFPSPDVWPQLDYVRIRREGAAPVLVEGRIDRVDVFEAEGKRWCVVVDYKTRDNTTLRARTIEEGYSLQLPLYLMALEQAGAAELGQPIAAEWYCLEDGTRRRVHFPEAAVGMARREDSRKWEPISVGREGISGFVLDYVRRLVEGDVRVDPHPEKICDWCDFPDVCRIAEKVSPWQEEEE